MSENPKSEDSCNVCKGKAFAACSGCGIVLCEKCSLFELLGSGCGTVLPVYFCPTCVQDPHINPNAVLRD